ncbi:MAG: hemerythrin domain-containing protein [Chloroflexota bacterium]
MQARAPLMIEHRLIERMVGKFEGIIATIRGTGHVNPDAIDTVVDFIRVYADHTHHGKEEDILFRELEKRDMSDEHRKLMQELIHEHAVSREATGRISDANARHRDGDTSALSDIWDGLNKLLELYPQHIDKEDNRFFPETRKYFSSEEEQAMIQEFHEFDRKLVHEKYKAVVDGFE